MQKLCTYVLFEVVDLVQYLNYIDNSKKILIIENVQGVSET